MLSPEEISEQHTVLRIACDPASPFFGMVDFSEEGGLLSLPLEDQQAVYNAMDDDLREMVEKFKERMEARA